MKLVKLFHDESEPAWKTELIENGVLRVGSNHNSYFSAKKAARKLAAKHDCKINPKGAFDK